MPKTLLERLPASLMGSLYFAPSIAAFFGAALLDHFASLTLLIVGNALAMAAVCKVLRFDRGTGFSRSLSDRTPAYCILLAGYTGLVALLTSQPLAWLLREGSLGATLALSGAIVLALIALWRWWPAFGLLFVWRDASPSTGMHATTAIRRSVAFAWNLTGENDVFFSHGLIVAICLAAQTQAGLSLAGFVGVIPEQYRLGGLAIYALLFAPLTHWVIATRSARVLLIERRRARAERVRDLIEEVAADPAQPAVEAVPPGLSPAELDGMLLRCLRAGQTELALTALARGADPNCLPTADERDQRPALVLAIVNPDLRLLRALIQKGADLNRAFAGVSPLIAATRDSHEGRPDAVMTLLTNGAKPGAADSDGNTALHFAALAAHPIVAALLCDAEAPLDAINREGLTPLGVACATANWELARFLLDRGAKIETGHAQPALVAAANIAEDDALGVKLLLKRKARPDANGPLARTALMAAALNGHADIARALLGAGAKIDLADAHGTTALMEAARSGAHAVLDVFMEYPPAADAVDGSGRSALVIASQSKQASEATVRRLLSLGASCALAASDGRRAVDFAAAAGRWNIVALLDPQYPLPANLATGEPVAQAADSPAHLLDALRFEHWDIVDKFAAAVRAWPQQERADLFCELASHADCAPRQWILNQGLDPGATLSNGTPLLTALLADLPTSAGAVADLHAAGAQTAGSNALMCLCACAMTAGDASNMQTNLALALLERGAEPFAADVEGHTPLAQAIAHGNSRLARALLARGVDPNPRDRHGCTPLFAATQLPVASALECIKLLLAAGADPEAIAANGETPLGLALARPEVELQHWLNWPLWKLPPRSLRPADLAAAAVSGDLQAVTRLLDLDLPIDAVDAQGATALVRASGCGHAELVAYLLAHGADAARCTSSGATALSAAISARRDAVVEALLSRGVAVDQPLPGGGTALMIAAALGYPEIIAQLLAHGAKVDAEDERGMRALHAAAQFAFQSRDEERARRTLECLLERGATVDAVNATGQTALLLLLGARAEPGAAADQRQLLALLPSLLKRHANLNAQDQRGVGALHACAMHGLLLPARTLLAAGADPERRDILERAPRAIAHLLGFIDVAAELGASSANVIHAHRPAR